MKCAPETSNKGGRGSSRVWGGDMEMNHHSRGLLGGKGLYRASGACHTGAKQHGWGPAHCNNQYNSEERGDPLPGIRLAASAHQTTSLLRGTQT